MIIFLRFSGPRPLVSTPSACEKHAHLFLTKNTGEVDDSAATQGRDIENEASSGLAEIYFWEQGISGKYWLSGAMNFQSQPGLSHHHRSPEYQTRTPSREKKVRNYPLSLDRFSK